MNRKRGARLLRQTLALLCGVAVAFGMLSLVGSAATARTTRPSAANCALYNYNSSYTNSNTDPLAPTLYIWNLTAQVTARVYDASGSDAELIGQSISNPKSDCCLVPLWEDLARNGYDSVYVTLQEEGKRESLKTEISYMPRNNPEISLAMYSQSESEYVRVPADTDAVSPAQLTAGKYYVATVELRNVYYVQSLTLPIRYDPRYLNLVGLAKQGSNAWKIDTSDAGEFATDADGMYFTTFADTTSTDAYTVGGLPLYGVGTTPDVAQWGGKQATDGKSALAETPYLNTITGLLKLELSTSDTGNPARITSNATSIRAKALRLYFKCVETPPAEIAGENWTDNALLHFATAADIPEGVTDPAQQKKYYNATAPGGARASIRGYDISSPPLSAQQVTDTVVLMESDQLINVPRSASAATELSKLLENQVKIYNYTNSGVNNLDSGMNDALLLMPSKTAAGAARPGDLIKVYGSENELLASKYVGSEGGVGIELGNKLDPGGGVLYVTVTPSDASRTESSKIPLSYPAEATRDVYFRIYSSGFTQEEKGRLIDLQVKKGDQLRLDLCFNNFEDLAAYSLALKFDPEVVQAADAYMDVLENDKYIDEETFFDGTGCFVPGADMTEINYQSYALYDYWTRLEEIKRQVSNGKKLSDEEQAEKTRLEEAIQALQEILEIDDGELETKVAAIASQVAAKASDWNGGLIFKPPVDDGETDAADEAYPYVDNAHGLIKLAGMSASTSQLRSGDEAGFHFLSIYLVGVSPVARSPDFGFATSDDAYYDATNPTGHEIVLSAYGRNSDSTGVQAPVSVSFTPRWEVYATELLVEGKEAYLLLERGNGIRGVDSSTNDVFLYLEPEGVGDYVDPGYKVLDVVGQVQDYSALTSAHWSYHQGTGDDTAQDIPLPPWDFTKEISLSGTENPFVLPEGAYSATYTVTYFCQVDGEEKTASRRVHVICRRGDIDRNGVIDLFDEQAMANYLNGFGNLTASYEDLYWSKTADVDQDGVVDEHDREAIRSFNLGLGEIAQNYTKST